MKNKEKYADKILEIACNGDIVAIDKRTNELRGCRGFSCSKCLFDGRCKDRMKQWAEQEYVEYETDWSKVPVDTPVLVNNDGYELFTYKRYFAKYEDNKIYCWNDGRTSFSISNMYNYIPWEYVKLANEEDKIKYRKVKGE